MKYKVSIFLLALFIFVASCTTQNKTEISVNEELQPENIVPQPTPENQLVVVDTPTPPSVQPVQNSTTTPSPSATIDLHCDPPEGYVWSQVFSNETGDITAILPIDNDSFLISSSLDAFDGTLLIKINSNGDVLWQKKVPLFLGVLEPAPNGNFLLVNSDGTLEFDADTNIIHSADTFSFLPQEDGSSTLAKGDQVMRFTNPESPQWAYSLNIENAYITLTLDGGAISAYAGSYADQSVYYRPIYTDIKINKIDSQGQVWQRTYGKLVGAETLDYVGSTTDGGAILVGTHTYEELGVDYDIWMMKVNQTGAMSWQSTLKHTSELDYPTDIFPLTNGILILAEDLYTGNMRLVKLNKNGSLAWQNEIISIRGPVIINAASDMSDGSILLSGETREFKDINFLVKMNSKGKIVWEKLIGFDNIENTSANFIETIYPLDKGDILIGGGTNLQGSTITDNHGAWIARIKDEGSPLNFLNLSPGKFNIITTLSGRPNNLPDDITEISTVPYSIINTNIENSSFPSYPACLPNNITYSTPQALPSLTPSLTPTLVFQRDLYLTQPDNMQGEDVLKLQQRLLELGYDEAGIPDGYFGKMTDNAVRLFQEKNGLEVDGYVGSITWKTLFSNSAIGK